MKRALALFAKTPEPGQVKTRLTPALSPEAAADLYLCMLVDTVNRVRTLEVETFLFYDGDVAFFRKRFPDLQAFPQDGDDLGMRMQRAFTLLASMGYGSRIILGTDAPDLPLSHISDAFRSIESGSDVVFGPAEDGGYYLVALSGGCADLFYGVPWSGPTVLQISMEKAKRSGLAASLLPPWYDVDSYDDLYRPGLSDSRNGAPLTRAFIGNLGITSLSAANAY